MIPLAILFSFISLGILLWIIFSATKAPFLRMLQTRSANIEEAVNQSRNAVVEANNMYENFKSKLAGIDQNRASMLKQLSKDLEKMKRRIVADAVDLGEKIKHTAERTGQHEIRAARARLQWEVASAAINLAREKLEKHLTIEDDRALQEEVLTHLGQKQYGKSITREALREGII